MIYLPPFRRFLLPALILLAVVVFYRSRLSAASLESFVINSPPPLKEGVHIPIASLSNHLPAVDFSNNHLLPPQKYFYNYNRNKKLPGNASTLLATNSSLDSNLGILFKCSRNSNLHTNHIRLPNIVQNISNVPPNSIQQEYRAFWNPTIISLPYWSKNQYLIVSRIVTDGGHQENVLCEANICYIGPSKNAKPGEVPCTADDLQHLGPAGGMRCVSAPVSLSVPPTPADRCRGKYAHFVDIPGFHDPRIFWSGRGEPLMIVNTQYTYLTISILSLIKIPDHVTPASASG